MEMKKEESVIFFFVDEITNGSDRLLVGMWQLIYVAYLIVYLV